MSDGFINIVGWVLVFATFVITISTILYYNKVMKLLRGGEGWILFRYGLWAILIAVIFHIFGEFLPDYAVPLAFLGNLCVMAGCLIFVAALARIYGGVEKVRR